jgi:hypothetical protein
MLVQASEFAPSVDIVVRFAGASVAANVHGRAKISMIVDWDWLTTRLIEKELPTELEREYDSIYELTLFKRGLREDRNGHRETDLDGQAKNREPCQTDDCAD